MTRAIHGLLVFIAFMCGSAAWGGVQEGRDYKVLSAEQQAANKPAGPLEVQYFFFYGCPHCYRLQPGLKNWESSMPRGTVFTLVPVMFNSTMTTMANAFYALESLGKRKQLHDAIFKAMNEENIDLTSEAAITNFVSQHGVDAEAFTAAYHSSGTQGKVQAAGKLNAAMMIRGTPTLIVNGKYMITGLTPDEMIRVLTEVVRLAGSSPMKPVEAEATPSPAVQPSMAKAAPSATQADGSPKKPVAAEPKQLSTPADGMMPVKGVLRESKFSRNGVRPKTLDLRYCLDLPSSGEIIKCAEE